MLRKLRHEKVMRGIMIAVLAIVIPSFVAFYGWQSRMGRGGLPEGVAATIKFGSFGDKMEVRKVDMAIARQVFLNKLQGYARLTKENLDPKAVEELATPNAIVREAINLKFLEHFARENGIIVTEDEVMEEIKRQVPPEQREMFIRYIEQRTGMSFDEYIARERYARLLNRVRDLLAARTRVSVYDAWLAYKAKNEKLVLDYVKLLAEDFANKAQVSEDELKAFYEKNASRFEIPDRVEYAYLLVRKADLKTSVTVTDDDITSYYNAHLDDFRTPPKAKVRQIFLARPQPDPEQPMSPEELTSRTAEVRARATEIFQRIVKGEDFTELADRYNEPGPVPPRAHDETTTATDDETTAGGNLGFIDRNTAKSFYGDAWTSAVFNLAIGAVHPPVETARGFHILKVEERKESSLQPLDKVRELVQQRVADEKVLPIFDKFGEELRKNSQKYTSLEKLAEVTSLTVQVTPPVDKGSLFLPGIGFLGDFQEAVFDLQKGGRSDVLSDANRHLVIEVRQEYPAHIPPFEEIREKVEREYRLEKGRELARQEAEAIKSKAVNLEALKAVVAEKETTLSRTAPLKRAELQREIGPIATLDEQLEQAKTGQVEMSVIGPEKEPMGYVVWHLAERIVPDQEDFRKELPRVAREVLEKKLETLLNEYLRDQWRMWHANIKIDPAFQ
ncbi:MAG: peptidyl-prolyl cis-trans isomerase [Candidatus Sumerlaeaceae bacterium]|nr:peptidyl-prolyl cis-trans isomerase [Candidatus Sumerlaeaceae bacterium]